jgi:hypothetical protein
LYIIREALGKREQYFRSGRSDKQRGHWVRIQKKKKKKTSGSSAIVWIVAKQTKSHTSNHRWATWHIVVLSSTARGTITAIAAEPKRHDYTLALVLQAVALLGLRVELRCELVECMPP